MLRGGQRLTWITAGFLVVSLATRVGLALFSGEGFQGSEWSRFLALGFLFDVAILAWVLLPWAVYDALIPASAATGWLGRGERLWAMLWAAIYLGSFLTLAAAEFAFWGEFNSRFDFIAVDYLVYTHEVLGNIWESYPVGLGLAAILTVSLLVVWRSWPRGRSAKHGRWTQRWRRFALLAASAGAGLFVLDPKLADFPANTFVEQLSMNGMFAFVHAYRNNELDYARYYPTLGQADLQKEIRTLLQEPHSSFSDPSGIDRQVSAYHPLREANVVLISVESLSADFLGHFGNTLGLTPELDRLADEGLLFTNLFATGTRTVRGLEALSVGTPPTPGQSIVRRPNNDDLENLGEELGEQGWSPYWIYGGYGFFDNMNAYFAANHYQVVDRSAMAAEGLPIHHENIWGIADEDLYSLALANLDREHDQGHRFFAHIMTTSNHRPFTFPDGRVDLSQKHREGAVKYTDWAIGDFIRRSAAKPWFDNTVFIILADHTAKAAGRADLPPERYRIPMIWYGPKLVAPGVMPRLMSQIDVAPTLLGWLGLDYESRFFGYDIFALEPGRERAFISTYQKLGYLKGGRLLVLDARHRPTAEAGVRTSVDQPVEEAQLAKEAIAWYQAASSMFKAGQLKDIHEGGGPANPSQ